MNNDQREVRCKLRHKRVDAYYREHGKFNKKPSLFTQGSTGLQDYRETLTMTGQAKVWHNRVNRLPPLTL